GDGVDYTVTVTNNGTGTAHGFSISDTLPAGLTWAIDGPGTTATGCAISTGVLSCGSTATDLAPSASVHVHVTATSSSANCPSISNTASASATNEPSGVLTNNSSTKVITVNCADLTLIKVRDATTPATVSAGDHVGYVLTVTNGGAGIARNVSVSDTLPTNTGLSWSIDAGGTTGTWTNTAGVLSFGPVDMAAAATFHVHITSATTAATCGTVSNSATSRSDNDGSPSAGPVAITVNCPDLSVAKTTATPTVSAGDGVDYTVTVTNNGTGTAHGFSISDTLPAGLTWAIDGPGTTATGCAITTGVLSCGSTATDLAPSASVHVHVTATSSSANCPSISNTASASATNEPSGVLTNNSSTK